MSSAPYFCGTPRRRAMVRDARNDDDQPFLNGLDYVEVDPADQRVLHVHLIHPAPGQAGGVPAGPPLEASNIRILGGVRVIGVGVEEVTAAGRILTVRVDRPGDFSSYSLSLVTSPSDAHPPAGFDPVLASVQFSFKVNCTSDVDCRDHQPCATEAAKAPYLNYLAKDYASFVQVMFDRLSVTMPGWRERNPADIGVALVELLAYTGDQLSYYQDAVATEAYLGTARRRTSVRRHARLVDYHLHEGCNARAWLVFETTEDRGSPAAAAVPAGTQVLTAATGSGARVVFETLHEVTTLTVARNAIQFHTWGEAQCCLPRGATTAVLTGSVAALGLAVGDVLIFEEVRGGTTGRQEDADRTHRHAVRLSEAPEDAVDPLTETPVVRIRWSEADALPFALCLDEFEDEVAGTKRAAVARANVALADHGRTVTSTAADPGLDPARVPETSRFRPVVSATSLTFARPFDHDIARQTAATSAIDSSPREALPAIGLRGGGETWTPRRDLLTSGPFSSEFVVETEDDGRARLRFGDGILGRAPAAGTLFTVTYRVGNGNAGNVGAEALTELSPAIPGVKVRNPLAARGGVDPEPTSQARLYAPQAFRTSERAVTEADYAEVAGRHPEVQRAAATRRWTGSWHTMFITVDRRGGRPVDADFEREMRRFLERYRMAGYDIEIDAPRFVPLDISVRLCLADGAYRGAVLQSLRRTFGTAAHPDGTKGLFHPDNFTFGQPVVLSQLRAKAMDVAGVRDVLEIVRFQRYGQPARGEIDRGFVPMHRLEIAQLDNDPSALERGRIEFQLEGGL